MGALAPGGVIKPLNAPFCSPGNESRFGRAGAAAAAFKGLDLLTAALSMDIQQQMLIAREVGGTFFLFVMQMHRYLEANQIPTPPEADSRNQA